MSHIVNAELIVINTGLWYGFGARSVSAFKDG